MTGPGEPRKRRYTLIIGPPAGKAVLLYDEETMQVLLFDVTYSKKIEPGTYTSIEDIVEILVLLARHGHEAVLYHDPRLFFKLIEPVLLTTGIPLKDKREQLYKYIRVLLSPRRG